MRYKRGWTIVHLTLLAIAGFIAFYGYRKKEPENVIEALRTPTVSLPDSSRYVKHPEEYNVRMILERNIFGSSEGAKAEENQEKTGAYPELQLLGTIAGDRKYAVIRTGNRQDLYTVGDIVEGVQINGIERNKISISYNGQVKELMLYPTRSLYVEDSLEHTIDQTPYFANVIKKVHNRVEIDKSFLNKVGGETFSNILSNCSYVEDENKRGLRIDAFEDGSITKAVNYIGFEEGDVIQAINGQELTDKQKTFQVLKKLRGQKPPELKVEYTRDGKEYHLTFKLM